MTKFFSTFSLFSIFSVSLALAAPTRPSEDNLTQAFATARRAQVESVSYDLSLTLNKGSEAFKGTAILQVKLKRKDLPLSVDFTIQKINSLKVNGTLLTKFTQRKGSFDIPAKFLADSNTIEVEYTGTYNKEGYGFQRSVDPIDSSEYVFTDFEPYYAHYLFPCFDQPDLKASYVVHVNAPSDWKVIANDLVEKQEAISGGRTLTHFAKSKPISPYLVFVGAGPFVEWTDMAGTIPLVLYARKSLAQHVDH